MRGKLVTAIGALVAGSSAVLSAVLSSDPGTSTADPARGRRIERALALRPLGATLDVVVLRTELGASVVVLDRLDDGWSARTFPGLGPDIEALAIADGNGDGVADLLVQRATGSVEIALGDGTARFVPREKPAGVAGAAHHGHHGGDFRAGATLALAERDAALRVA